MRQAGSLRRRALGRGDRSGRGALTRVWGGGGRSRRFPFDFRAKASVSGSHCSGFKKCSSEAARARKSWAMRAAGAAAPICAAARKAPAKPLRTLRWRAKSLASGAVETSPPRPPLRRASAAEDGRVIAARTTGASFARGKGAAQGNRRQEFGRKRRRS